MSWLTIFLFLPFIIGMLGEVVQRLVLPGEMPKAGWPGWRGVYFVTYKAHALAVGAGFGSLLFLAAIPWPKDVFGEGIGGAMFAGAVSGGVAMVAYASIVGSIKNLTRLVGARAGSAGSGRPSDPGTG
jgi:hypothetical protein